MIEFLRQYENAVDVLQYAGGISEAFAILLIVVRTIMWQAAHYPHQFKWVRSVSFLPLKYMPFTFTERVRHVIWIGVAFLFGFLSIAFDVVAFEVAAENGEDHFVTKIIQKNF